MSARRGEPQAPHTRRPSEEDLRWQEDALCRQVDPELFFADQGNASATRAAKRVCGNRIVPSCPVREQCLEYALTHNERFGVWGGKSERERRDLKRRGREPFAS